MTTRMDPVIHQKIYPTTTRHRDALSISFLAARAARVLTSLCVLFLSCDDVRAHHYRPVASTSNNMESRFKKPTGSYYLTQIDTHVDLPILLIHLISKFSNYRRYARAACCHN